MDPGMDTFQVPKQKKYQEMVIISFLHLEKIKKKCFMEKERSLALKLTDLWPFKV